MIPISSYGAGKLMVIVLLDLRFKTDGGEEGLLIVTNARTTKTGGEKKR